MWAWLDWFGLVLFDATLSTTLFLGVILLGQLVSGQPVRRILAARVAVLASLVTLPLMASASWPRFDVVRFVEGQTILHVDHPKDGDDAQQVQLTKTQGADALAAHSGFLGSFLARHGKSLRRVAAVVYILGSASGAAWLLMGCWGVSWLIRQGSAPCPALREVYDEMTRNDRGRRPRLVVSSRLTRPVLAGIWNPTILIPAQMEAEIPASSMRLVLLHELAHFNRRDHWFGPLAGLAQTLWFFVPPVWRLRSQLLLDQEYVADLAAAAQFGGEADYAQSLLELATRQSAANSDPVPQDSLPADSPPTARPSTWRGSSPLIDRVLVLLHSPYRLETSPPRAWSWRAYLIMIALSISVTFLRLRWPDQAMPDYQLPGTRSAKAHYLVVNDFIVRPATPRFGGRSLPYVLPITLPDRFRLEAEILADTSELASLRIAGHALAPPMRRFKPRSPSTLLHPNWHTVEIERHGAEALLHIDGIASWIDRIAPTTSWLTIEPIESSPIQFRNLKLTW